MLHWGRRIRPAAASLGISCWGAASRGLCRAEGPRAMATQRGGADPAARGRDEPPDLALVVNVDAGTEARASSPRRGRRLEPLDGAAR